MKCISCNSDTEVYDSRLLEGNQFRRKRKCCSCGCRFSTFEVLEGRLATRVPRTVKPKPIAKPKPIGLPKALRASAKPVKSRRPEDDVDFDHSDFNEEIRDVARELGIDGFN